MKYNFNSKYIILPCLFLLGLILWLLIGFSNLTPQWEVNKVLYDGEGSDVVLLQNLSFEEVSDEIIVPNSRAVEIDSPTSKFITFTKEKGCRIFSLEGEIDYICPGPSNDQTKFQQAKDDLAETPGVAEFSTSDLTKIISGNRSDKQLKLVLKEAEKIYK